MSFSDLSMDLSYTLILGFSQEVHLFVVQYLHQCSIYSRCKVLHQQLFAVCFQHVEYRFAEYSIS